MASSLGMYPLSGQSGQTSVALGIPSIHVYYYGVQLDLPRREMGTGTY